MNEQLEQCPNCKGFLPAFDGPTHRYLGASAACWALFSALNIGEPPVAPTPSNALLVDAYAAQHYGEPSPQAIQSVAVHLITLYGVLEKGHSIDSAFWLRTRPLRSGKTSKHERHHWLIPPDFTGALTVADIAQAPTPEARAKVMDQYVESVWSIWAKVHRAQLDEWYQRGILADEI